MWITGPRNPLPKCRRVIIISKRARLIWPLFGDTLLLIHFVWPAFKFGTRGGIPTSLLLVLSRLTLRWSLLSICPTTLVWHEVFAQKLDSVGCSFRVPLPLSNDVVVVLLALRRPLLHCLRFALLHCWLFPLFSHLPGYCNLALDALPTLCAVVFHSLRSPLSSTVLPY